VCVSVRALLWRVVNDELKILYNEIDRLLEPILMVAAPYKKTKTRLVSFSFVSKLLCTALRQHNNFQVVKCSYL
jgi:hypothetical protein